MSRPYYLNLFEPRVNPVGEAYALAVLSMCSYYSNPIWLDRFREIVGMDHSEFIQTPGVITPNFSAVYSPGHVILAFQGTTFWRQFLWEVVHSHQTPARTPGGKHLSFCHAFFWWQTLEIWNFLKDHTEIAGPNPKVVLCGHSLGGAIAQLMADLISSDEHGRVINCMSFNSPRIGNAIHAHRRRNYDTYNWFHIHDMVCEYPIGNDHILRDEKGRWIDLDAWTSREFLRPIPLGGEFLHQSYLEFTFVKLEWLLGKVSHIFGIANSGFRTANNILRGVARPAGLLSWATALAEWIPAHWIASCIEGLDELLRSERKPRPGPLQSLFIDMQMAFPNPIFVAPGHVELPNALNFMRQAIPPGGIPAAPPIPQFLERIEMDVEFSIGKPAEINPPAVLIDNRFDLFLRQAWDETNLGQNQSAVSDPFTGAFRNADKWRYWWNGPDRDLIAYLAKGLRACLERDLLAISSAGTTAISTRELILDEIESDLYNQAVLLLDNCNEQLAWVRT